MVYSHMNKTWEPNVVHKPQAVDRCSMQRLPGRTETEKDGPTGWLSDRQMNSMRANMADDCQNLKSGICSTTLNKSSGEESSFHCCLRICFKINPLSDNTAKQISVWFVHYWMADIIPAISSTSPIYKPEYSLVTINKMPSHEAELNI